MLLIGLKLNSCCGKVTPKPLIPKADKPKVCLLSSFPQTIARAGIGETPLSSSVRPVIIFPVCSPVDPLNSNPVELNSGDE